MSKAAIRASDLNRVRSPAPTIDTCAIVPILACAFATIGAPLIGFVFARDGHTLQTVIEARWDSRIFWPAMAAISVVLVIRNRSRLAGLTWPPHIICLFAYLALAGVSALWAFSPQLSFIRFMQQMMIVTSIVLPAMIAIQTANLMRGVFLCFAIGSILNLFFVFNNSQAIVTLVNGYPGYFANKNYLGEFAGVALLLSLHEALFPGRRRAFGIIVFVIAALLLFLANSKTALGLAILVPCLAAFTLLVKKFTRISPVFLLLSIPVCYAVLSSVSGFNMNRVSYLLYGDPTFTGRTVIWDFANFEIGRKPLLGWGYQSFWLVGPDAPSVVEAPGWVKSMPNAHNGYLDTMLETGYIGFTLFVSFIIATLYAIGRVANRDPTRAWLLLSLAMFVIFYNFLESLWMRGFEFLWVLFVIVAAEAARCWQPFPSTRAAFGSRRRRPSSRGNASSSNAASPSSRTFGTVQPTSIAEPPSSSPSLSQTPQSG